MHDKDPENNFEYKTLSRISEEKLNFSVLSFFTFEYRLITENHVIQCINSYEFTKRS